MKKAECTVLIILLVGAYASLLNAQDSSRSLIINTSPCPEWSDGRRAMGQGVPTIERSSDGRLWVAFRVEYSRKQMERSVMLVTSDDDGSTWSEPKIVIHTNGDEASAFDPALWHDPTGKLWFFWSQRHWPYSDPDADSDYEAFNVWAITTENSGVENPTWSEPRKLMEGVMLNKPVVLSTGEWLFPSTSWREKTTSWKKTTTVFQSEDQGATIAFLGGVHTPEARFIEHMIIERKNGTLWMLSRPNWNDLTGIAESVSKDQGKTWTEGNLGSFYLRGPNSRFFLRRLQSGRMLLVYHDHPDYRTNLTAYLSEDEGKSWKHQLLLDDRASGKDNSENAVSYPDAVEADDGRIFVVYDRNRQTDQEILLAIFTEEDIIAGDFVTEGSRSSVLINNNHKQMDDIND